MHSLVRVVFERLYFLDPEIEERTLAENGYDAEESEMKMSVSTKAITRADSEQNADSSLHSSQSAIDPFAQSPVLEDDMRSECKYHHITK